MPNEKKLAIELEPGDVIVGDQEEHRVEALERDKDDPRWIDLELGGGEHWLLPYDCVMTVRRRP